ncbi:MAG: hypothetical protein E7383_03775 [Ruminococcaceae bacterium]|nr:hypothetical protein [Oscillospiraceae bacterium]
MNITGLSYKFIMFSPTIDQIIDADIPFTGDNLEITENFRFSNDISVKHFKLTNETIGIFRSLIEKYKITEWIGKTSSDPVIYNDEHTHVITSLTLKFDDGTSSEITFREGTEDIYKKASDEFRKAFFTAASNEALISEEKKYPALKEARLIKEEHGPVTAIETHHFSSGMMYNSNVTTKQKISKIPGKDGTVLVELYRKAGNLPEQTDSKEVESDIFAKIQEISDKENIPGWHYVQRDPSIPVDRSMMPMDYSASSSLTIIYDDSLLTGCPGIRRTIGETACEMGGSEVDKAICELIRECVTKSGAHIEVSNVNPYIAAAYNAGEPVPQPMPMNGFMGMGMMQGFANPAPAPDVSTEGSTLNSDGTWDCKCGTKGLTGKFCSECGYQRPTA